MRKILQKAVLSVLLLVIILFCASCDKDKSEPVLEEEQTVDTVEWSERKETVNKWKGSITYTECDGVRYAFKSKDFDEASATGYVEKIRSFLTNTDALFSNTAHEEFTIYLGFEPVDKASVSAPLTLPMEESLSFDHIWEIMKRAHSSDLISAEQYGLLYLYCKDREIIADSFSDDGNAESMDLKQFFDDPKNIFFLDFTIPMLDDVYFTEEQATTIRKAVLSFSTWYTDTYSYDEYKELCQTIAACDRDTLVQVKNDWLKSIGCTTEYIEPGKIFFRYSERTPSLYGTKNVTTYEIETEDAIWLWDDLDVKELGYTYMATNYNKTEPLRILDFAEARDFLKDYLPEDLHKVLIYTNFERNRESYKNNGIGAYYISNSETITLYYDWQVAQADILHEYIHHLTMGEGKIVPYESRYFPEWFSVWLSELELTNRELQLCIKEYDSESLKNAIIWDNENECYLVPLLAYQYVLERYQARANLDESRTITSTKEIPYPVSLYNLTSTTDSYGERGSLAKYIYETYGMEKLVALAKTDGNNSDFEEILGISFDQLYFDMVRWVQTQIEKLES